MENMAVPLELKDALKEIVHRRKTSQLKLAQAAGYKSCTALSGPITNNDMRLSTLIRIAKAAGYDVMLVAKVADPLKPEQPIRFALPEGKEEPRDISRKNTKE